MPRRAIAPRPQLLTYPDSLGGGLRAIGDLLDGPLDGLFRGVHVLPPFPSSADRGFAPLTYTEIDPRFGDWADIERLSRRHDVLLDLMINHVSRQSAEFRDFLERGRESPDADLFITVDKVWPGGEPDPRDVAKIFLRKPDAPFSDVTIAATGERETVWTSFGTADWSEQIDLDVTSDRTRTLIRSWLATFAAHGVRIVRLDAVGYVIKQAGTSCFMVEPEIYAFLDWMTDAAAEVGLVILPEVHDIPATGQRLSERGYWTYDFVLPALLLQTFATGDASRLADHLDQSPDRQFTTLDCHDGIPVRPDLDGILDQTEMLDLARRIREGGGNVNVILSEAHASGVDVHQLNATYYSALECDDGKYVAARAIQLFARGVPQIYYVGLLAGENDLDAVIRAGDGRAINRHDYSAEEIDAALRRPVVKQICDLVRLRNESAAFGGELCVECPDVRTLRMRWMTGTVEVALEVDFEVGRADIRDADGLRQIAAWNP